MANLIPIDTLKRFSLFQDFEEEDLIKIQKLMHYRAVEKDEIILLEGDLSDQLIFVERGWIKSEKTSKEGRQQTLRFIGPMEVINEYSVFSEEPNAATIIALEKANIYYLNKSDVKVLLVQSSSFARAVIVNLAKRIQILLNHVENLSLYSVEQRLARYLLDEAKDGIVRRQTWKTQAEIAAHLGTVVDVVNRILQKFERQGLISISRKQFKILDNDSLKAVTEKFE
ncbi:MAG: Crp/Fnr family transcriptional regulator [Brevefilum sp.]|nr:Crp/Fnr family transcriptional regulator [Brevefilum sp.]MDT8381525.1 Crp/Fnr family transcriptional regulator [Brevefilum sp.]